ncbi:hypothetical protein [Thermocrinis albus]|uniref:hypothetical protein n=1 Tax=Thermocrinis albus TaxID=136094 RepID=UPI00145D717C|nr:hypothetical protein [Thermocrinis albus]
MEKRLLLAVASSIKRNFSVDVRHSSVVTLPPVKYSLHREECPVSLFLDYMEGLHFPNMLRIVGLVDVCLRDEERTIWGKGVTGGRSVVVSVPLLKTYDEKVFFERVCKESVRQLGMSFGLPPCEKKNCVMYVPSSLQELDQQGTDLCPLCKERWVN